MSSSKSENTRMVRRALLEQRADNAQADILSAKLDAIGESRGDIAPAAGEKSSSVKQSSLIQELDKCRKEHARLSVMLSDIFDKLEQSQLSLGAKKLKKTKKKKRSKRSSRSKKSRRR